MGMRITEKMIEEKFQNVFHELGLKTDKDVKLIQGEGFSDTHFKIDFNPNYGGYEIRKTPKGETYVSVINPGGRLSNKEMWRYLQGMETFTSRASCQQLGLAWDEKKKVCKLATKPRKK